MNEGPKRGHTGILATAIAVLLSAPALAGDHSDRVRLDTNHDGKIDLAEAQAARPDITIEKFNAADANRDGQLSRDEWPGARGKSHRWGRLDADQDGIYTLDEVRAAHPDVTEQEYSAFDADTDGKVTKDELKLTLGNRLFDGMDKDGDGGVSLAEMQAIRSSMTQEKFSRMDKDGNGLLSKDEMRAAHKARHDQGQGPEQKPAEPPGGG